MVIAGLRSGRRFASRRRTRRSSRRRAAGSSGQPLGKAHALANPGQWKKWLRFLRRHPRVSLAVWATVAFTDLLCLRVSEAGALRGDDFDLQRSVVKIKAFVPQ